MCVSWPYLLLLVPAVPIIREDFRMREVSVAWLSVLGTVAVAVGWLSSGLRSMAVHTLCNMIVAGALLGALSLWLCLRERFRRSCRPEPHLVHRPSCMPQQAPPASLRSRLERQFGAGDAVTMLAMAPLFAPSDYVSFLLAACLAALGWWIIRRPATIPLAGFLALALAVYALFKTAGVWN